MMTMMTTTTTGGLEKLVGNLKSKLLKSLRMKKAYDKIEKSESMRVEIRSRKARKLIERTLRIADSPNTRTYAFWIQLWIWNIMQCMYALFLADRLIPSMIYEWEPFTVFFFLLFSFRFTYHVLLVVLVVPMITMDQTKKKPLVSAGFQRVLSSLQTKTSTDIQWVGT